MIFFIFSILNASSEIPIGCFEIHCTVYANGVASTRLFHSRIGFSLDGDGVQSQIKPYNVRGCLNGNSSTEQVRIFCQENVYFRVEGAIGGEPILTSHLRLVGGGQGASKKSEKTPEELMAERAKPLVEFIHDDKGKIIEARPKKWEYCTYKERIALFMISSSLGVQ